MKGKQKTIKKRKSYSSLILILMLISAFVSGSLLMIPLIEKANAIDITTDSDSSTTLTITVFTTEPRINWYDFQYNNSGTWVSKRNAQIDVDNNAEYRFIVNISSDQGWDDIQYINITAWADIGNDAAYNYNNTAGGNINMHLQYENTSGTAQYNLLWPHSGEVTQGSMTEANSSDAFGPGYTECHNLTFSFIPNYQFRYAPGDAGGWDNNTNATDDLWSWNFRIAASDSGENASGPKTAWEEDEFGVYSYTEIISAGVTSISGYPAQNATADSNVTVTTRSNGNYSLSVDVDTLMHQSHPTANISNQTIYIRGGDLDPADNLTGTAPVFIYAEWHAGETSGNSLTTNDVEFTCDIPAAQLPGLYSGTVHYTLKTETS